MNMSTIITPDEAIKLLGLATKPRVTKEIELSVAPDVTDKFLEAIDMAIEVLGKPEPHEIGYNECANALLKMWMDNVLTDGEYYKIADKLNEKWGKAELPEPYKGVTS